MPPRPPSLRAALFLLLFWCSGVVVAVGNSVVSGSQIVLQQVEWTAVGFGHAVEQGHAVVEGQPAPAAPRATAGQTVGKNVEGDEEDVEDKTYVREFVRGLDDV